MVNIYCLIYPYFYYIYIIYIFFCFFFLFNYRFSRIIYSLSPLLYEAPFLHNTTKTILRSSQYNNQLYKSVIYITTRVYNRQYYAKKGLYIAAGEKLQIILKNLQLKKKKNKRRYKLYIDKSNIDILNDILNTRDI